MIPSRGCVYVAKQGSGAARGFYSLKPELKGSDESPILLAGVDATLQDIVFPVVTLDEKKYFYTLGDDFGNIGVNGMVLLGPSESRGEAFNAVMRYFQKNRVSALEKPISISCPGNVTINFFLTALTVSRADPEFHIQFFQLRGNVVEPKKA